MSKIACMGRWWHRTVESLRDYIEVYGWADPTHTVPPVWVEDGEGRSRPGDEALDPQPDVAADPEPDPDGYRRRLDGTEPRRTSAA